MNVTPEGYFKPTEIIVDAICAITQNYDRGYSRNLVNYHFTKEASIMRCSIQTDDSSTPIPVNMYLISLATSGNPSLLINGKTAALVGANTLGKRKTVRIEPSSSVSSCKDLEKTARNILSKPTEVSTT